jgi:hypothetical protein
MAPDKKELEGRIKKEHYVNELNSQQNVSTLKKKNKFRLLVFR